MLHSRLHRLTLTMHAKLIQDFLQVIADRSEGDRALPFPGPRAPHIGGDALRTLTIQRCLRTGQSRSGTKHLLDVERIAELVDCVAKQMNRRAWTGRIRWPDDTDIFADGTRFSSRECRCRFDLRANGPIGFAFELVLSRPRELIHVSFWRCDTPGDQISKRYEVARGVISFAILLMLWA
jgi:hypothetical protein